MIKILIKHNNNYKFPFYLSIMEEIENQKFKKRIIKNLDSLSKDPKKDFQKTYSLFDKSYIIGGFVRDSILQVMYNYKFPINDLDILIKDKNFNKKAEKFQKQSKSRFGSTKLKYPDFDMDIIEFSHVYFLKDQKNKNIENFLNGCDLSTSSFVYDIDKNKIYNKQAIDDIRKKEINILNKNTIKAPTICRLILHADKMKFKIGKSGKDYIKSNYSLELESAIRKFLEYKNIKHTYPLIKNKIDSIIKKTQ